LPGAAHGVYCGALPVEGPRFRLGREGQEGSLVTRVALIGLPGAGKTAVAPILARRLGFEIVDLDAEIERLADASVSTIIDARGEAVFRDLESRALERALGQRPSEAGAPVEGGRVVACGGGVLGRAENRERLKRRAWVVWLRVDTATAARRLAAVGSAGGEGAEERPLLRGGGTIVAKLGALLEARAAAYEAAADASVETRDRTAAEVAEAITPLWEAHRARWGSSES